MHIKCQSAHVGLIGAIAPPNALFMWYGGGKVRPCILLCCKKIAISNIKVTLRIRALLVRFATRFFGDQHAIGDHYILESGSQDARLLLC